MKKTIYISILLAVFTMISCNQKTVTKMDSFIEGKVEKVILNENSYGITLKTATDSLVYANIEKSKIPSKDVKVGDHLQLKGEIWCLDTKENCIVQVEELK